MNKLWVVALETYKRNVKSPTFLVMIFAPFLMIGFSLLGGVIGNHFGGETSEIAIVTKQAAISQMLTDSIDLKVDSSIKSEAQAKKALEKETIDGYLLVDYDTKTNKVSGAYIGDSTLSQSDKMMLQQSLSSLQLNKTATNLGLTSDELASLNQSGNLSVQTVSFEDGVMTDKADNQQAKQLSSIVVGLAMYVIILMYSQVVATEVASEKGTRIMEIILSSTSASKHFYGKILGVFLVILTQVMIYLVLGVGGFLFTKNTEVVQELLQSISIKDVAKELIGYNLLYLLLGVVIYTILSALCGSLVSKAEDAGKAVQPVTYVTLIGFLLTMVFGMNDPENILIKITSFIPFLSSFTMPARIASQTTTPLEVTISLVILIVAIILLLKLAAKIYRSSALVYSDSGIWQSFKKTLTFMKK